MSENKVYMIRPGEVVYIDLCAHTDTTRSDFFNQADLKTLHYYGLILEAEDVVKVLHCDDVSDDSECEGIVIPRSCVVSIRYFVEDTKFMPPIVDDNGDLN